MAAALVEGKLVRQFKARLRTVEKFYNKVDVIVDKSLTNIDETKSKLNREIRAIIDVKGEVEIMHTYVTIEDCDLLRDIIIETAKTLSAKCAAYGNKH